MSCQFFAFHQSLDADPVKRGRQFEHFVKWFLKADSEWSTQVDQVWLWHEYPERWGADCGIDLVFRHKNGEHWAVQAKCYSPDYDITKHDVDKFLSESNRPGIKHRLLIATTDRIGAQLGFSNTVASVGWSGRWPLRAAEARSRDRGSPLALSDDDAGFIGIG